MVKRVFVHEYLSGGGLVDGDEAASDELLAQGLAMRDAIVADLLQVEGCQVRVATCARAPCPPAGARPVQPHRGETPLDFAARQAALHELIWVVAPETGGLLAAFHQVAGAAGWLGCDGEAIRLASSKQATLRHLAAHGVPTPLAFVDAPGVTRWVVKPDDGAGSVDTRLHLQHDSAREDLARRARAGAAASLEPWVEGEPLSLSLLCAGDAGGACELLSINRQRLAAGPGGMLRFEGVDVNAADTTGPRGGPLNAVAAQVAQAIPGLRGFVGIDLVWHDQAGPVVIEVNPRVTCAYVGLSAALGRNLAADVLNLRARAAALRPAPAHNGVHAHA